MENEVELGVPTQTTAAGLIRLAAGICELLHDKSIDSRFGAKLLKRLEKEAQQIIENRLGSLGSADELALRNALGRLKHALQQSEAGLLVQTIAKLRSNDEKAGSKKKSRNVAPDL